MTRKEELKIIIKNLKMSLDYSLRNSCSDDNSIKRI